MLSKSDLDQIRKVIREEVGNEAQAIKDDLSGDIMVARANISTSVNELTDRVKNLEIRQTKMHRDLKEDLKGITQFLDKENMKTLKRVKEIERHLNIATD